MKHIDIALLGLGNVGRAFARYVENAAGPKGMKVRIKAIADSSGGLILDNAEQTKNALGHKESGRKIKDFGSGVIIPDLGNFISSLPGAGIFVLVESLPTNMVDAH